MKEYCVKFLIFLVWFIASPFIAFSLIEILKLYIQLLLLISVCFTPLGCVDLFQ